MKFFHKGIVKRFYGHGSNCVQFVIFVVIFLIHIIISCYFFSVQFKWHLKCTNMQTMRINGYDINGTQTLNVSQRP